jgi:hypothetical protein
MSSLTLGAKWGVDKIIAEGGTRRDGRIENRRSFDFGFAFAQDDTLTWVRSVGGEIPPQGLKPPHSSDGLARLKPCP